MHADVEEPGRTIVPTLRYRDVAAAIDWLCRAFGFERHLVVPDDNPGTVASARKLGIGTAQSVTACLDILERATAARAQPGVLAAIAASVGWK